MTQQELQRLVTQYVRFTRAIQELDADAAFAKWDYDWNCTGRASFLRRAKLAAQGVPATWT